MLGTSAEPGIIFLTVMELYSRIEAMADTRCQVAVSYVEVSRHWKGWRGAGRISVHRTCVCVCVCVCVFVAGDGECSLNSFISAKYFRVHTFSRHFGLEG